MDAFSTLSGGTPCSSSSFLLLPVPPSRGVVQSAGVSCHEAEKVSDDFLDALGEAPPTPTAFSPLTTRCAFKGRRARFRSVGEECGSEQRIDERCRGAAAEEYERQERQYGRQGDQDRPRNRSREVDRPMDPPCLQAVRQSLARAVPLGPASPHARD